MIRYEECLLKLKQPKIMTDSDGLSMIVKKVPEADSDGVVDPRQKQWTMKCMEKAPIRIVDMKRVTPDEIDLIRKSMGCKNNDLSSGIITESERFNNVKVEIYKDKNCKENVPAVVYFHGGGFIGGTIGVIRNSCKLLAERSHSVVISVDYDLAPEHRFPSGLHQCYSVVDSVFSNSKRLRIDSSKVAVIGDSAGANFAAACCLMDTKKRIRLQVLLYPVVNVNPEDPDWTEEKYYVKDDPDIAHILINDIRQLLTVSTYSYVAGEKDFSNPFVSPYFAEDPRCFPTTLIVSPEYDYLRKQAEDFSHLLIQNGVDVVLFRYQGMGHAFFEHTGEFPQAEDCINEIASAIMAL